MPPKQYFFKVKGNLKYEAGGLEDDFSIFIKAMDDQHAVMLVREHLKILAPQGKSIIRAIEKKTQD